MHRSFNPSIPELGIYPVDFFLYLALRYTKTFTQHHAQQQKRGTTRIAMKGELVRRPCSSVELAAWVKVSTPLEPSSPGFNFCPVTHQLRELGQASEPLWTRFCIKRSDGRTCSRKSGETQSVSTCWSLEWHVTQNKGSNSGRSSDDCGAVGKNDAAVCVDEERSPSHC